MENPPKVPLKTLIVVLFFVGLTWAFQSLSHTPQVIAFTEWINQNYALFITSLYLVKTFSIIYPPSPGMAISLAAVPLIGWQQAYVIDLLGSVSGASISYYFGKQFGLRLLRWCLGADLVNRILKLKVKGAHQIEASFLFRIAAGGLLSDGLCWGANLIGFRYIPFIIGYTLSHPLVSLPFFLLVEFSFNLHAGIVTIPLAIIMWFVLYKLKGRYLE